jgi:hypothetical protein
VLGDTRVVLFGFSNSYTKAKYQQETGRFGCDVRPQGRFLQPYKAKAAAICMTGHCLLLQSPLWLRKHDIQFHLQFFDRQVLNTFRQKLQNLKVRLKHILKHTKAHFINFT